MYFSTLKEAMETRGVRAYQLADLIKVSAGTFSMRMHGRIPFSPIERKRISEYFGLSEETLFEAAYFRHMAWLGGIGPRPSEQASKVENAMAKTPGLETR
jgi:transcriptional regulator with XRE-family HTH domain